MGHTSEVRAIDDLVLSHNCGDGRGRNHWSVLK